MHVDVAVLEAELKAAGVALSVEGSKLVLEGSEPLSAELVERCRAGKEALLDTMKARVRTKSRVEGPLQRVPSHIQLGNPKRRRADEPRRFQSGALIDLPRRRRYSE